MDFEDKFLAKVSGIQSLSSSVQSTPEKNGHSDDASRSPELLQEFLKSGPKKELLRTCFDKDKKNLNSSKHKMSELLKTSNKTNKKQESKKASSSPNNHLPKKQARKGENPMRLSPASEQSPDFGSSNSWICKNSACRAVLPIDSTFCKRCSCCICHLFDDNKDPSLWLVCTSESGEGDSCGLSCHIECALQREKVGVVDLGQLMQLDGSYCCASCGKVSGILGSWKKQLIVAKDARRVDVLCYRIYLSYRLLDATSRFKELYEIVKEAKSKLETEVGPVNGVSAKMARGIVSRLSIASDLQKLCSLAIEKADEWLANISNVDPNCRDVAGAPAISKGAAESDVLKALSQIIDPDFGTDIVSCGFVKDLDINEALGEVSFRLELTTPACPIKDMFEQKANEVVNLLPWVKNVSVTMSAQPARPIYAEQLPAGLQTISNIIAVSSCKGGVGKSTVAVNLAYTLAGMGARVGIFDADVYGPSLPTMVSPENRILVMNPEKKTIIPTEYLGVKLVSFGFAGQGRAIMRGPMVSGVINQLLTTTEWGELDYLVVDMPPGTGDIQLTLCQVVPLTAAVIVTTPQKLAFIDVAKGVRMFSKLKVPCVAVVENMSHFDADGKRYYPFGRGSGSQVVEQFGIPNLFDLPIRPTLSASGDSGTPEVVADPLGEVSKTFQDIGICVVQQCAKIRQQVSTAVTYDKSIKAIRVKVPDSDEAFLLHPATVRRNDRSAQSVDEWTGEQKLQFADVPEDIEPEEIRPMGNYAVSITWPDGFSQIAPYDQLQTIERLVDVPQRVPSQV